MHAHNTQMKKYGECEYCGVYNRMTKEHVVPRCFGGQVKIWVCANCNNDRGHSGKDPLFLKWVRSHEDTFQSAVNESIDRVQTDRWLEFEGLNKYRIPLCF